MVVKNKIYSSSTINVHPIKANVYRKRIKNLYIRIDRSGKVMITAPLLMQEETIKNFLSSKINWITKHTEKINPINNFQPQYLDGETHFFLGQNYQLKIDTDSSSRSKKSSIEIINHQMILTTKAEKVETSQERQRIIECWYRDQLQKFIESVAPDWEKKMGVQATWFIKKMKTRWGSCNPQAQRIWINLELIKKPPRLIEYVMVHELVHFFERGHNRRFYTLMSQYFPEWKTERKRLNSLY